MPGDKRLQRLDHGLDALIGAEQPEGHEHPPSLQPQARLVRGRILKRHRRGPMVDPFDPLCGHPIALHQELTGPLRHHHHAIRPASEGDQNPPLVLGGLVENRVQGDHQGFAQGFHEIQHICAIHPPKDPILMLQADQTHMALVQVIRRGPVVFRDPIPDLEDHLRAIGVAMRRIGEGNDIYDPGAVQRFSLSFCDCFRQIMGECGDPALPGHVSPHQSDPNAILEHLPPPCLPWCERWIASGPGRRVKPPTPSPPSSGLCRCML
ncbi:hypothetical protein HRbin22_01114 [Candidatus Thermoflexus japonica]|uniref:Uncharacterized protein n=1 Tax=Candidatus Thermoflexus japonica TaxID=2035417 RepID=A0A2H5Y5Z7_9CHLR|nr:hypothetical protein HRbin22_01114 [Candidatus Thermoflexus japonica]